MATNEFTNKMSEQTQVNTTNVEVPLQVTKDPKKVAAGKRLAEWRHKNKEKLAQEAKAESNEAQKSEPNISQAYGTGAVIAVRVLGLLGYYIYNSKEGDNNDVKVTVRFVDVQTQKRADKFEMEKILLITYTKRQ